MKMVNVNFYFVIISDCFILEHKCLRVTPGNKKPDVKHEIQ